jgi:hypothetical protein
MPNTLTLISSSTVGAGGASNIEFTSIPATYTDLLVLYSLRTTLAGGPFYFDDCAIRVNGDTGANYSIVNARGRQNATASFSSSTATLIPIYEASGGDATTNAFGIGKIYIHNYAGSTKKAMGIDGASETNNATEVQLGIISGVWNNTSAITSIRLYSQNGTNFVQHSSAYLYGIAKG